MTRDQTIAHLSLLGWMPIVSRSGVAGGRPQENAGDELRLLNPALRHNIVGGAVRSTKRKMPYYFHGWDSPEVDPYWAATDWRNATDDFLRTALYIIEGERRG